MMVMLRVAMRVVFDAKIVAGGRLSYKPGTVLWELETPNGFGGNPAIGRDGTIYCPIRDRLYALDPNGNIKWDYYAGKPDKGVGTVIEPAIGGDGTVYTGSIGPGIVHALDGKTGTILWEKKFEKGLLRNSPCVGNDGILYIITSCRVRAAA